MERKKRLVDDGNRMGRLEDDGKGVGKKRRLLEEESNFDSLPDDIVARVFDRLGWKDASNTCLVSRRYHRVSKTCVMYKKKLEFVEDKEAVSCFEFVKSVNNILYIHEGLKVDSLRIAFNAIWGLEFQDEFLIWMKDSFNDWVSFVREKCVRSLDIGMDHSGRCRSIYKLQFPTFEGFDKLTSLSLAAVDVDDAVLEQGLKSHLVNLESLFIGQASHLREVVINASTPRLKKLEISRCYSLCSVDIASAPNLECFRCLCNMDETMILKFQDVLKLSDVCLGDGAVSHSSLSELWKNARMLDKLEATCCLRQVSAHPQFGMFDKLTSLSLESTPVCDADLKHLTSLESLHIVHAPLLQMVVVALPKLKTLEIRLCYSIRSINIDYAPNLQCFRYQCCCLDKVGGDGCGEGIVHLKHVPKLSDLDFFFTGNYLCLKYLSEQLSKAAGMLERLELVMAPTCRNAKCRTNPQHFPLFGNLKELKCHIVLDGESPTRLPFLTHLLAACPKLRKLAVNYQCSWYDDERWGSDLIKAELRATSHVHYCLKEVELRGWCRDLNDVQTLHHLHQIAPNLEKLRLG